MSTNLQTTVFVAAVLSLMGTGPQTATAAVPVYEGFDYAAGDGFNGSSGSRQTGGTGLESVTGWTTAGSNAYDVWSTGLSFGTLDTTGRSVRRSARIGDAQMNRAVTANVTSGSSV